ncbi:MAG: hypothetical protein ACKO5E_18120 [bacterium]
MLPAGKWKWYQARSLRFREPDPFFKLLKDSSYFLTNEKGTARGPDPFLLEMW